MKFKKNQDNEANFCVDNTKYKFFISKEYFMIVEIADDFEKDNWNHDWDQNWESINHTK